MNMNDPFALARARALKRLSAEQKLEIENDPFALARARALKRNTGEQLREARGDPFALARARALKLGSQETVTCSLDGIHLLLPVRGL